MRFSVGTLALVGLVTALAVGCSDDDKSEETNRPNGEGNDAGTSNPGPGNPDPANPDGGSIPSEPPVYAVATFVTSPAQTTYVVVSPTLTGELSLENAVIELPGLALVNGPPGGKRLYVGTSASGLVTRYDLGADGASLVESGSVNFEAKQVTSINGYASSFQFVDAHKAYWLSTTAGKVVVWDPEDMAVTGEIATPEVILDDPDSPGSQYTASATSLPIRDGNMLYYFTAWDSRQAGTIKVVPKSTVIAIDTTTDTAQVVVNDIGCGYTRDGIVSGDYIYLVTEAVGTSVNYLNPANGPAPTLCRFNKTTKTFDASYKVELNELTGGAPVGSLVTSPSGQAFVYVLDRASADPLIADGTISNPRILSVSSLWKTGHLTVGDTPKIDLLDAPLASSSVLPHPLLNGLKVTATFDPQDQQIREVSDHGVVATDRANAKVFGHTGSIVQLR